MILESDHSLHESVVATCAQAVDLEDARGNLYEALSHWIQDLAKMADPEILSVGGIQT